MLWYIGAPLDGVIVCSIDSPMYDISCISTFAHNAYNVVGRVLTVVFHIFLGAFHVVAKWVMFHFVIHFNDTRSGQSLSITSAYG